MVGRGELSPEQLAFLKNEQAPSASLAELLANIDACLHAAERLIANIPEQALQHPRYIGKKRLPSTVLGLLVHVAEHTQRHLGQAITTAKLVRGAG